MFGRDSVYVLVGIVQIVIIAIVTPILVRVISEKQYGIFAADLALEQALVAFFSLGMVGGAQRTVFQHGRKHAQQLLFVSALMIAALASVLGITSGLWASAAGFRVSQGDVKFVVLWAALAAATQIAVYGLRAIDKLHAFAMVCLLQAAGAQILGLTFAVLFARSASDIIYGYAIMQGISLVVAWTYFHPMVLRRQSAREISGVVRFSLTLMPQSIAFFLINAIDRLMILHYLGASDVARYQIAYYLGGVSVLLSTFFHQTWETRAFSIPDRNRRLLHIAASRDQLLGLFCLIIASTAFGGPSALYVLAPRSYETSTLIGVLVILSICAFPHSLAMARSRMVMADGRGRMMMTSTVAGALTNVLLNLYLIPHYGLDGAALSVLVSFCVMDIVLWAATTRHAKGLARPSNAILLSICLSLSCVTVAYALPQTGAWFWIRIALGLIPAGIAVYRFVGLSRRPLLI